jgi:hypothetical protein
MTPRSILFHMVIAFLSGQLLAQPVSQIEGYLEVYHPDDTTSIYIGKEAGRVTDASITRKNTILGNLAGQGLTTGYQNSFYGEKAGQSNTIGYGNSFFGRESGLSNIDGFQNSFFGTEAGKNITKGNWNSFFGAYAGLSNDGQANSFFGFGAGRNCISSFNSFFGSGAGSQTTTGGQNCFFGETAGSKNTIGGSNCFFGFGTGYNDTTGGNNCFFGTRAGYLNASGNSNCFFGYNAGQNITGSGNICIGASTGPLVGDGDVNQRLYIDNNTTSTPLIYGEFDNDLLQINGTLTMGNTNHFGGNDDGLIRSSSEPSSDLFLISNDAFIIELDDDNNETGNFEIWDGEDQVLLKMLDGGQFEIWDGQPTSNRNLLLEANGDLSINGVMTVGALGSAGATAVCRNASGELSLCSSSIRYKNDVEPFTYGLELLRQLNPVTFRWKDNGQPDLGLIAEEVNTVEPLLTTINNQLDGFHGCLISNQLDNVDFFEI